MYSYSFIIPHKNSPGLLQRCLDSIPEREDVQIIVVDDNSDSIKVDFEHFPGLFRKNTKIIFNKEEKGAGHARNIGLQYAEGKWVLFADADDYYNDGFLDILDSYCNSECDVVYFDYNRVDSDSLSPIRKEGNYTSEIKKYSKTGNSTFFKYSFNPPWNKMVKKKHIEKNHIIFEEVRQGNDTMYSLQVGYYANKVDVIPAPLYFYTWCNTGITHRKWNDETYLLCIENIKKKNKFLEKIGCTKYKDSIFILFLHFLRRKGLRVFLKANYLFIKHYKDLKAVESQYVNTIIR